MPKPVIGAINGVAAGAGASLALACDLRVMADDASLLQAFVNIALVPDAGSTYFLTRLVGYSRALEIALSGARVPAARCLELGLANRVVPATELPAAAQGWAAELAQGPTQAIGLTKQLLHQATLASLEEMLEREAELQTIAIQSADHREGVAAFREKRIPRFQGR
jgi:2-(1,2-epoxy-1,2-dihydrophenyl)acetyl-CoA isomerase